MEQERIYILCMLFIFLLYTYSFGNHNSFTKMIISVFAIGCLYTLITSFQLYSKGKSLDRAEEIQLSNIKEKLYIDQSIQWLEYDDFLSNVIVDLYPIVRYDIEILKLVILKLNKYLKTYYTSMSSKQNQLLLYKNIRKNQTSLQSLEDKKLEIIEELKNLVYVLPTSMYYVDLNIPEIAFLVNEYLEKKIVLLSTKFKMKQTKFASASL